MTLTLLCDTAASSAAAARDPIVGQQFHSHVDHVQAVLTVVSEDFGTDIFFVQKDANLPAFGFFDFSLRARSDVEGLLAMAMHGNVAHSFDNGLVAALTMYVNAV